MVAPPAPVAMVPLVVTPFSKTYQPVPRVTLFNETALVKQTTPPLGDAMTPVRLVAVLVVVHFPLVGVGPGSFRGSLMAAAPVTGAGELLRYVQLLPLQRRRNPR